MSPAVSTASFPSLLHWGEWEAAQAPLPHPLHTMNLQAVWRSGGASLDSCLPQALLCSPLVCPSLREAPPAAKRKPRLFPSSPRLSLQAGPGAGAGYGRWSSFPAWRRAAYSHQAGRAGRAGPEGDLPSLDPGHRSCSELRLSVGVGAELGQGRSRRAPGPWGMRERSRCLSPVFLSLDGCSETPSGQPLAQQGGQVGPSWCEPSADVLHVQGSVLA